MRDELVQVAAAVRDEPELEAMRAKLLQHGQRVLVERELVVQLPRLDDVGGTRRCCLRVDVVPHAADDALGEGDPDVVVVDELWTPLQRRDRMLAGRVVAPRVEHEPVPLADVPVALWAELGAGQGEREVHVEEDGPNHAAEGTAGRRSP
jgi:hypothetical protein